MSASSPLFSAEKNALQTDWHEAITEACGRIAPTWPLDQINAINPFWEMRNQSVASVAARMAALNGTCFLNQEALAIDPASKDIIRSVTMPDHWRNLSAQLDRHRDMAHQVGWQDEIVHQISQFCGDYFQRLDAGEFQASAQHLYYSWLEMTRSDRGIAIVMEAPSLPGQFRVLPDQSHDLIANAFDALALYKEHTTEYAHALLLDINGWSSWASYLRWQSRLQNNETDLLPGLLAIRLAWELVLWRHVQQIDDAIFTDLKQRWINQWQAWPSILASHEKSQVTGWQLQTRAESAYQQQMAEKLLGLSANKTAAAETAVDQPPPLQAAFCIDVRSEVFRRALEAQDHAIQTLGFAGFFGMPIAYRPRDTEFYRPQLPGLLAPSLEVTEKESSARVCRQTLARQNHWVKFTSSAPASFSYIESFGIARLGRLVKNTFLGDKSRHPVDKLHEGNSEFEIRRDGVLLSTTEKAELVAGILQAMSLTRQFAPIVLLVGHGSSTRNNPHAAGLDCGACGGQTGSVNVRVLAYLLNDSDVRSVLAEQGLSIPQETRFIGALHDTTTDEVTCSGEVPQEILNWLRQAGQQARRERAGRLGLGNDADIDKAIKRRSQDWSEVRPEWGLAGNASLIVAPRSRTRHLNLEGRSFLHDYRWREDDGFRVLELIMTAPMLVTHWINFQYFASVTDNLRYGSGNKVLHNVVGGHLGVFEGNGGDLRIGLPMQSIHDGHQWVHEPLRLSVYIVAPREAITDIASRHAVVRELIDNDWLYLFRLDDEQGIIERFYRQQWETMG